MRQTGNAVEHLEGCMRSYNRGPVALRLATPDTNTTGGQSSNLDVTIDKSKGTEVLQFKGRES